jgi:hypothetical protein
VLGNRTNLPEARAKGIESNRKIAVSFAANILPVIRQIAAAGASSFHAIADALNARVISTARGGNWHASTVRNLILRDGAR